MRHQYNNKLHIWVEAYGGRKILAKDLDVTTATIGNWILKKSNPKLITVDKISRLTKRKKSIKNLSRLEIFALFKML